MDIWKTTSLKRRVVAPAAALSILVTATVAAEDFSSKFGLVTDELRQDIPFLRGNWASSHGNARVGRLIEQEPSRYSTDGPGVINPTVSAEDNAWREANGWTSDGSREKMPATAADLQNNDVELGIGSDNRHFTYVVNRRQLHEAGQSVADLNPGVPVSDDFRAREDDVAKAWSNGVDNRVRRGYGDGYSSTAYSMFGDYGGCSGTIIKRSSTEMWVMTAAHCLFTSDAGALSTSKFTPREDHSGTPNNPYGVWKRSGTYGYFSWYLSNSCESNWQTVCIQHDIAVVRFIPDGSTSQPSYMAFAATAGSTLGTKDKYRRGYPACGATGSPSSCTSDTLYGDEKMSLGSYQYVDSDNWNRVIKHSSDTNGGDSGSGPYYYDGSTPRVFGVNSAEDSNCYGTCTSSRPNWMRRITPIWRDFVNSII